MSFKQKDFMEGIEYNFYDKGVIQSHQSFLSKTVVSVSFEDIGSEIARDSYAKKSWLIASVVLYFLGVFMIISSFTDDTLTLADSLFYFIPAIVCTFIFRLSKKERIYILGSQNLEFFYKEKQIDQIHGFINEIIMKRNEYYKNKYGIIETDLTNEQQINKFRWLKNEDIITQEEFDHLIEQLQSSVRNA